MREGNDKEDEDEDDGWVEGNTSTYSGIKSKNEGLGGRAGAVRGNSLESQHKLGGVGGDIRKKNK